MESTTGNGSFTTALFQGLAVVLFLYAVIFTAAIFKNQQTGAVQPLASAVVQVIRPETTQTQPQPLQPEDVVSAPQTSSETAAANTEPVSPEPDVHNGPVSHEDMIEMTAEGPLPKRSDNGATPFDVYKRPFTDPGKPVIALAILDYGLSEGDSKKALYDLPAEVSLLLNPYAQNFDTWKSLAVESGHEFWVYLPMENLVYPNVEDPGPQALLAHSDFKYNQEKFYWALSRITGYAGMAGYTDGAFLNAQSVLKALWNDAYNRGIGYFELNPSGLEGVEMNAVEMKAPYVRNTSILDESRQDPAAWLAGLEQEASNNGYAVGIIRNPFPQILDAVNSWAAGLEARGFAIAPVSALAQIRSDQPSQSHATPQE